MSTVTRRHGCANRRSIVPCQHTREHPNDPLCVGCKLSTYALTERVQDLREQLVRIRWRRRWAAT